MQTHMSEQTHSISTHIQISCQPRLNTCSLTQVGFDWFCFSQAFKFNLQLESCTCTSFWVCACVREWAQLHRLRINSIENTLFLYVHHPIPFTLLALAFACNISPLFRLQTLRNKDPAGLCLSPAIMDSITHKMYKNW